MPTFAFIRMKRADTPILLLSIHERYVLATTVTVASVQCTHIRMHSICIDLWQCLKFSRGLILSQTIKM